MGELFSIIEIKGSKVRLINGQRGIYLSLSDLVAWEEKNKVKKINNAGDDFWLGWGGGGGEIGLKRQKRKRRGGDKIRNWLSTDNALDFCSLWEEKNNEEFFGGDFKAWRGKEKRDGVFGDDLETWLIKQADERRLVMTASRWQNKFKGQGICVEKGRGSWGVIAAKEIALVFCSWLNGRLRFYLEEALEKYEMDQQELEKKEVELHKMLADLKKREKRKKKLDDALEEEATY